MANECLCHYNSINAPLIHGHDFWWLNFASVICAPLPPRLRRPFWMTLSSVNGPVLVADQVSMYRGHLQSREYRSRVAVTPRSRKVTKTWVTLISQWASLIPPRGTTLGWGSSFFKCCSICFRGKKNYQTPISQDMWHRSLFCTVGQNFSGKGCVIHRW